MTKAKTVELGDVVKDRISGFKGVATCCSTWLNGCVRWTLQPEKLGKDGASAASETFDIQQLEVVSKKKIAAGTLSPGGPRPEPSRGPRGF